MAQELLEKPNVMERTAGTVERSFVQRLGKYGFLPLWQVSCADCSGAPPRAEQDQHAGGPRVVLCLELFFPLCVGQPGCGGWKVTEEVFVSWVLASHFSLTGPVPGVGD